MKIPNDDNDILSCLTLQWGQEKLDPVALQAARERLAMLGKRRRMVLLRLTSLAVSLGGLVESLLLLRPINWLVPMLVFPLVYFVYTILSNQANYFYSPELNYSLRIRMIKQAIKQPPILLVRDDQQQLLRRSVSWPDDCDQLLRSCEEVPS